MSFTIKLAGTPYEFKAEATETILEAGDKAGFLLDPAAGRIFKRLPQRRLRCLQGSNHFRYCCIGTS